MPPVSQSSLGANPFSCSRASISLDALRATAALLVFTDHARHTFFVEYHEVLRNRALLLLPYLISACGHQAVVVFFVLSGFLVGGSIFRSLQKNTWTWKQYLTHRFVRLWLVLLPALVLVFLIDSIHARLQANDPSYGGAILQHLISPDAWHSLNAPVVFANAAFLQGIDLPAFLGSPSFNHHTFIPVLGDDGPLWSLANEFWYYILFPLGLFTVRKHYSLPWRALQAVLFLLIAVFVGKNIFFMFPIWICGTLLLVLPRPGFGRPFRIAATIAYAAAFIGCSALERTNTWLSDYLLTLLTLALLWTLLSASNEPSAGRLGEHLARGTARFSYTLYLVHMPMMYLLAGFLIHDTRWQPSLGALLIVLAIAAITLLYAWLVATVTEFRTDAVRPWVERRVALLFGS